MPVSPQCSARMEKSAKDGIKMSIKIMPGKIWYVLFVVVAMALSIHGCGSESTSNKDGPGNPSVTGAVSHALEQMDSCDAFLSYAKNDAIQRMRAAISAQQSAVESCWDYDENDKVGDTGSSWDDMDTGMDSETRPSGDADADSEPPVSVEQVASCRLPAELCSLSPS